MKKIFVAVDGSDIAINAGRLAFELAAGQGAEVTLVHVVPPVMVTGDAPWAPVDEIQNAQTARGEKLLEETRAALGKPTCQQLLRVGPVAETMADLAETEHADLLVVGSTGKGVVKRLLLGSTADRLVHISKVPVLVVR